MCRALGAPPSPALAPTGKTAPVGGRGVSRQPTVASVTASVEELVKAGALPWGDGGAMDHSSLWPPSATSPQAAVHNPGPSVSFSPDGTDFWMQRSQSTMSFRTPRTKSEFDPAAPPPGRRAFPPLRDEAVAPGARTQTWTRRFFQEHAILWGGGGNWQAWVDAWDEEQEAKRHNRHNPEKNLFKEERTAGDLERHAAQFKAGIPMHGLTKRTEAALKKEKTGMLLGAMTKAVNQAYGQAVEAGDPSGARQVKAPPDPLDGVDAMPSFSVADGSQPPTDRTHDEPFFNPDGSARFKGSQLTVGPQFASWDGKGPMPEKPQDYTSLLATMHGRRPVVRSEGDRSTMGMSMLESMGGFEGIAWPELPEVIQWSIVKWFREHLESLPHQLATAEEVLHIMYKRRRKIVELGGSLWYPRIWKERFEESERRIRAADPATNWEVEANPAATQARKPQSPTAFKARAYKPPPEHATGLKPRQMAWELSTTFLKSQEPESAPYIM